MLAVEKDRSHGHCTKTTRGREHRHHTEGSQSVWCIRRCTQTAVSKRWGSAIVCWVCGHNHARPGDVVCRLVGRPVERVWDHGGASSIMFHGQGTHLWFDLCAGRVLE